MNTFIASVDKWSEQQNLYKNILLEKVIVTLLVQKPVLLISIAIDNNYSGRGSIFTYF